MGTILPVFAGMVPGGSAGTQSTHDSPRIRGDGPTFPISAGSEAIFSPYSRGWSLGGVSAAALNDIFPVFAGMVRHLMRGSSRLTYFPRIRGDGPDELARNLVNFTFSPYSRGWSQGGQAADTCIIIFPVFAGMVPVAKREWVHPLHFPRIRGDGPKKQNLHDLISPFSPYSRGWSRVRLLKWAPRRIFPVFAGMIPAEIALRSVLMVILLHYDPD